MCNKINEDYIYLTVPYENFKNTTRLNTNPLKALIQSHLSSHNHKRKHHKKHINNIMPTSGGHTSLNTVIHKLKITNLNNCTYKNNYQTT